MNKKVLQRHLDVLLEILRHPTIPDTNPNQFLGLFQDGAAPTTEKEKEKEKERGKATHRPFRSDQPYRSVKRSLEKYDEGEMTADEQEDLAKALSLSLSRSSFSSKSNAFANASSNASSNASANDLANFCAAATSEAKALAGARARNFNISPKFVFDFHATTRERCAAQFMDHYFPLLSSMGLDVDTSELAGKDDPTNSLLHTWCMHAKDLLPNAHFLGPDPDHVLTRHAIQLKNGVDADVAEARIALPKPLSAEYLKGLDKKTQEQKENEYNLQVEMVWHRLIMKFFSRQMLIEKEKSCQEKDTAKATASATASTPVYPVQSQSTRTCEEARIVEYVLHTLVVSGSFRHLNFTYNDTKLPPLLLAIENQNFLLAHSLLNLAELWGLDVNIVDFMGFSAVHYIMEWLPDISIEDDHWDQNVGVNAVRAGRSLRSRNWTVPQQALATRILQRCSDGLLNMPAGQHRRTPLQIAIHTGNLSAIRSIALLRGLDVDLMRCKTITGEDPFAALKTLTDSLNNVAPTITHTFYHNLLREIRCQLDGIKRMQQRYGNTIAPLLPTLYPFTTLPHELAKLVISYLPLLMYTF